MHLCRLNIEAFNMLLITILSPKNYKVKPAEDNSPPEVLLNNNPPYSFLMMNKIFTLN